MMIFKAFTFAILSTLLFSTPVAFGDCTRDSPSGHYEGIAVSKEAGKLNISLDLRCINIHYEGQLVTPVGTYEVKTGTFEAGELKLHLVAGTDSVSLSLKRNQQDLSGQFASSGDAGPVNLHRTGEGKTATSTNAALQLPLQQWMEDVDFFARELPVRHANAFYHETREQFDAAIADLKHRLPQMNGDQIYVTLDSIANSIGDGHTYVEFPPDIASLPLVLSKFGDDYRVVATGPDFERALGARVLRIGDTAITTARDLAARMTPAAETTALADARIAGFLTKGITLHGLSIIPARNVASYTLQNDNGDQFTMNFPAIPPDADMKLVNLVKDPPLHRRHSDENFWFQYLPEFHTLYCNFRGYQGLDKNAADLMRELKVRNPDKLVIDLRQNGGGDYSKGIKYLIDPIRVSKLNRKGHLFVLIGVNTFSAAMSNSAHFREMTHAMLVGEPIGERPNSYQENREMRLPNSHLLVRYSIRYYEFAKGKENLIRPDYEIITDWNQYKAGKDPVLDWVLNHT